ncbi:MAG: (2Fe-2S)-binding protein [Melioribacteraceae bacterium]|nr:(2Fe-2S)-binding protein [Melioribacteraceae bacterium]MCF8394400.1 (2Fe-2S)-binding protein [Melioribacteraceae bacterium]MCF8417504.1 (2Fe-2S)-binding protein [Melioribacteraceae bacterium]
MNFEFLVNGKNVSVDVNPKKSLLNILRDELNMLSVKEGCGKGECGACTVLMNGKRVNSCLVPAFQLNGAVIYTIEGIMDWQSYKAMEKAYIEFGSVQCGFCMSGFLISTLSLMNENDNKISEDEMKWKLGGNICRCTGYTKIIEAVDFLSKQNELMSKVKRDFSNAFIEKI